VKLQKSGSDAKNQQIADGLSEGFLGNESARLALHHAPGDEEPSFATVAVAAREQKRQQRKHGTK